MAQQEQRATQQAAARQRWSAVDEYLEAVLVRQDAPLLGALEASAAAGLPSINVSPTQGKLLYLLARLARARRILEIGTLGGYSTIWLARALSAGGRLLSLEADPHHAEVARENVRRAGLADKVEIRLGRALETLPGVAEEGGAPFDFVFIDADKPSNAEYYRWARRLGGPGSLIVIDNVVRDGAVADQASPSADVQGVRRLNELIAADQEVSATAIQTVGAKGYDGMAIVLVGEPAERVGDR